MIYLKMNVQVLFIKDIVRNEKKKNRDYMKKQCQTHLFKTNQKLERISPNLFIDNFI